MQPNDTLILLVILHAIASTATQVRHNPLQRITLQEIRIFLPTLTSSSCGFFAPWHYKTDSESKVLFDPIPSLITKLSIGLLHILQHHHMHDFCLADDKCHFGLVLVVATITC